MRIKSNKTLARKLGDHTTLTKDLCSIHHKLSGVKDILTTFLCKGYLKTVNTVKVMLYLIYLDKVTDFTNCLSDGFNIYIKKINVTCGANNPRQTIVHRIVQVAPKIPIHSITNHLATLLNERDSCRLNSINLTFFIPINR